MADFFILGEYGIFYHICKNTVSLLYLSHIEKSARFYFMLKQIVGSCWNRLFVILKQILFHIDFVFLQFSKVYRIFTILIFLLGIFERNPIFFLSFYHSWFYSQHNYNIVTNINTKLRLYTKISYFWVFI